MVNQLFCEETNGFHSNRFSHHFYLKSVKLPSKRLVGPTRMNLFEGNILFAFQAILHIHTHTRTHTHTQTNTDTYTRTQKEKLQICSDPKSLSVTFNKFSIYIKRKAYTYTVKTACV